MIPLDSRLEVATTRLEDLQTRASRALLLLGWAQDRNWTFSQLQQALEDVTDGGRSLGED